MNKERKNEIFSEIKGENIKKKIHAQSQVEDMYKNKGKGKDDDHGNGDGKGKGK